jgi:hypothetical protein
MANFDGTRPMVVSLQTGQAINPFPFWLAKAALSSNQPSNVCPLAHCRS